MKNDTHASQSFKSLYEAAKALGYETGYKRYFDNATKVIEEARQKEEDAYQAAIQAAREEKARKDTALAKKLSGFIDGME